MLMPNAPAANIGLYVGARAAVHTPVSACASGNEGDRPRPSTRSGSAAPTSCWPATLFKPYTYNINSFTAGDVRPGLGQLSLLDGSAIRQIASLMLNGIDVSDGLSRAATQLAIWKIEYGNLFDPTNLSAGLTADMNSHIALSVIGGLLDCPGCTLNVLTDAPDVPNQALGFAVVATPLPAAVWLFGSGLGVLGLVGRRRRKQSCRSVTSTPAQSFARAGGCRRTECLADLLASPKLSLNTSRDRAGAAPTSIGRAVFLSTAATWRWAITRPRKMRSLPINGRRNSIDRTA